MIAMFAVKHSEDAFIMLTNVKIPTNVNVGILTFLSRINDVFTNVSKMHSNEVTPYFLCKGNGYVFTTYHVHMQYSVVDSL